MNSALIALENRYRTHHRRRQDFQRGVTLCQSKGTHQIVMSTSTPAVFLILKKVLKKALFNYGQDIVMAFPPPVVGCVVKNSFQKGGSRAPQDPPGYALVSIGLFVC